MSKDLVSVPLNKLSIDPLNVRQTVSDESVADLVASIEHKGVLQNLLVRPAEKKGHYLVSAGGRRFRAASILAEAGKLEKNHPMPVREINEDQASDISLTENLMRQDMHPMDQFEAFSKLSDEGVSIEDIAMRYGTTCTIVKKRLAISRVAPKLRELFRSGDMGLEALQAFTLTDDHEEQMRVWDELEPYNRRSHEIRHALANKGISGSDKRLKYLGGLEAYEAAGGTVKRDLFDERNDGYAMDPDLVNKLVFEKLEAFAETIRAQGWKWVSAVLEYDYEALRGYNRCYPEQRELSDKEQKELDQLTKDADELENLIFDGEDDQANKDKLESLNLQIEALEEEFYSPENIAKSGVYITLNYRGETDCTYGLMEADEQDETSGDEAEAKEKPLHTAKLMNDLTAQRTAALQLEVCHNPKIALAVVVHKMLLSEGYSGWGNSDLSCLNMTLTNAPIQQNLIEQENSTMMQLNAVKTARFETQPENPEDLWEWCIKRSVDELLEMMAASVSGAINSIEDGRQSRIYTKHLDHADQLASAVDLDMTTYFKPTAETYFKHLSKTAVDTVIGETSGEEGLATVQATKNKKERSATAEKLVAKLDWLPEPLRTGVQETNETGPIEAGDEEIAQAAQ